MHNGAVEGVARPTTRVHPSMPPHQRPASHAATECPAILWELRGTQIKHSNTILRRALVSQGIKRTRLLYKTYYPARARVLWCYPPFAWSFCFLLLCVASLLPALCPGAGGCCLGFGSALGRLCVVFIMCCGPLPFWEPPPDLSSAEPPLVIYVLLSD